MVGFWVADTAPGEARQECIVCGCLGCHAAEAADAFDQYGRMSARLEEQQEMTRAAEKLATEVSVCPSRACMWEGVGGLVQACQCGAKRS